MKCPLCGTEFSVGDPAACKRCPLAGSGCNLVCCPNCGYEWPAESKVITKMKDVLVKLGLRHETGQ